VLDNTTASGYTFYEEVPDSIEEGVVSEPAGASIVTSTPVNIPDSTLPEKNEYGVFETMWLQTRYSNLTASLFNTASRVFQKNDGYSITQSNKDIDQLLLIDPSITHALPIYLYDNSYSRESLKDAYQHIKDLRRANEAFAQHPIAGVVSGLFDPAEAVLAAGTGGLSRGLNVVGRVALGAGAGGLSGAVYASNQPSESDALLTQIAVGGLANAIGVNGATKVANTAKGTKQDFNKTKLGLPKPLGKAFQRFGGGFKKYMSFTDEVAEADTKVGTDYAQKLYGFASKDGETSAAMRTKKYRMELLPNVHALEDGLVKAGLYPKNITDRIKSWIQPQNQDSVTRFARAQQEARGWLNTMDDYYSRMGRLSEALTGIKHRIEKFNSLFGDQVKYVTSDAPTIDALMKMPPEQVNRIVKYLDDKIKEYNTAAAKERGIKKSMKLQLTPTEEAMLKEDFTVTDDIWYGRDTIRSIDTLSPDARAIAQAYIDSKLGIASGKMINERSTLSKVIESPYYMHSRFSIDQVADQCELHGCAAVAKAFGGQMKGALLARARGAQWAEDIDPEILGMWVLNTLVRGQDGYAVIKGYIRDNFAKLSEDLANKIMSVSGWDKVLGVDEQTDLIELMRETTGAKHIDISATLGQSSIFKHRFAWDYDVVSPDGIQLRNMLGSDIMADVEHSVLSTASSVAMSSVSYKGVKGELKYLSNADNVREFWDIFKDDLTKAYDGDSAKADEVMRYAYNLSMGNPVGADIGDMARAAASIANTMFLGKSGLYNLVDFGSIGNEFTTVEAIKEVIPALKRGIGFDLKDLTKIECMDLRDILRLESFEEGRFRNVVTRQNEDMFVLKKSITREIEWATQSVRFLNGMEAVRRLQINMTTSLYVKRLERAIKGNVKDQEYFFKNSGYSKGIFNSIKREVDAHGWNVYQWGNKALANRVLTEARTTVDNVILSVRNGERPRFMDNPIGKVAFAYQSFVFAANQKLLRRYWNQEGVLGVATLMTMQLPLACLVGMLSNVIEGRDPEKDLVTSVSTSMSALGLFTIPITALSRGELGGTFVGFGPVSYAIRAGTGQMDVFNALADMPFISANPASKAALMALSNEYKDN
jgi:hypothetical protein